jgi:hypothetical protein
MKFIVRSIISNNPWGSIFSLFDENWFTCQIFGVVAGDYLLISTKANNFNLGIYFVLFEKEK